MKAENKRKEPDTEVAAATAPAPVPATAPATAPAPAPGMRSQEETLTREERWQKEQWTREEVDPRNGFFISIPQWKAFLRHNPAARTKAAAEGFLVGVDIWKRQGGGRRKRRKSKRKQIRKSKRKQSKKSRKRSKTRRRR